MNIQEILKSNTYQDHLLSIQKEVDSKPNLVIPDLPYYYVYQITNTVNNKIYVGRRSSHVEPLLDIKYFGSGYALDKAFKKYPIINFNKTILHTCDSYLESCALEASIVDFDFINRDDNYNLVLGGFTSGGHSEKTKAKISKSHKGRKMSQETKDKISKSNKGNPKIIAARKKQLETPITSDTRRKLSEAAVRQHAIKRESLLNKTTATL